MLRRFFSSAAAAALPLLACACAGVGAGPSRDLALRHVVLYQNGVGYFERAGVLRDDHLRLRLREREMDDVLKTLVVVEQRKGGGGKPSTVTALLPQAKKAERDPEEATWLDVVLSPRPTAELSIAYAVPTAAWKSAYRVVLPDEKEARREALLQAWALVDNVSEEDWTGIQLTLATGAPLTFTTHLRDVKFVDRPEAHLENLTPGARGPVYAESTRGLDRDGDGIPDNEDACPDEPGVPGPEPKKNGCPQFVKRVMGSTEIQILKVVEFAADSDKILPAAQPILDEVVRLLKLNPEIKRIRIEGHASAKEKGSFELSARRGEAVRRYLITHGVEADRLSVESFGDARPIASNDTDANRARNRRVQFQIDQPQAPPPEAVARSVANEQKKPESGPQAMAHTIAASAVPRSTGSSFRYDITHPVTIPKMSTTMVTIVNEYIPGEDILLFRPDPSVPGSELRPFHAARIENKSGFGLLPGPVAIFGGGTFVGEGLLESLGRGQTAYIPYGLDGEASVRVEPRTARSPLRVVAAAKGVLTVEDLVSITTHYKVTVGDRPPARLFLRHARNAGYEPEKPPAQTETTDEALLVPVAVGSGWRGEVTVEERRKVRETISILSTEAAKLAAYLQGSKLSSDADKKLREMVTLRGEVGRLDHEIDSLRVRLGDLAQLSSELRESLRTIEKAPRAAALQQKLLERLADATKQTEELSRKLTDDGAALSEARARLAEGLRELLVEEPPAAMAAKP
jgi:outer membrane protein OmpA-like peptidoglycan-associated protein